MKSQDPVRTRVLATSMAVMVAAGALITGVSAIAAGPVPPSLSSAYNFAVLAGSGITNTGPTTIRGDVGSFPTTTQTGFASVVLTGVNHGGDAVTQAAKDSLTAAYLEAASRGPASPVVADLGGQNLPPGVYNAATSLGLTGALTLTGSADDVWIFQAGSTLTTGPASSVVLAGGAQACNVYWQVGSSATLDAATSFKGTILALTSITLVTGASIDGRALARNGAVTMDTNRITRSDCAVVEPPVVVSTVAPTASPTAGATSTPTPLAAAATPVAAAATPAAAAATPAPAAATPLPAGQVTIPSLPSSSTQDLGGVPTWVLVLLLPTFLMIGALARGTAHSE
jgi:hypothetical protein